MYLLVWEFRVWGFRVWDNRVVLHLRSGESKVDGTGDHKLVRCPSIGSFLILMQTLNSVDFWGLEFRCKFGPFGVLGV